MELNDIVGAMLGDASLLDAIEDVHEAKVKRINDMHNMHRGLCIATGKGEPDPEWYNWAMGTINTVFNGMKDIHDKLGEDEMLLLTDEMIFVVETTIAAYKMYSTRADIYSGMGLRFTIDYDLNKIKEKASCE